MSSGFSHESSKNISVDWYTPEWIFKALGLEFDLDPCSPPGGVPWIPAKHFYTIEDDGLTLDWSGLVWLNPPYGKHTKDWLKKMHHHRNGVALVFARTDCGWFHDYCAVSNAILFLRGRIRFVDGHGVTGNGGPGSGSMLLAWGEQAVESLRKNKSLGLFVEISEPK